MSARTVGVAVASIAVVAGVVDIALGPSGIGVWIRRPGRGAMQ